MNHAVLLQEGRPIDYAWLRREFFVSLAEARYDQGLTQAQLASLTGIPQPAIAKIENGDANPTINTILKLMEAMQSVIWTQPPVRAPRLV